jgi:hypothetical protein
VLIENKRLLRDGEKLKAQLDTLQAEFEREKKRLERQVELTGR